MGFEVPEPPHIRLIFTDPSFAGLEVVCRLVPVGQLTEAASLATVDPKAIRPEDAAKVERLVDAFSRALVEWNLTRKGRKIPPTRKGIDSIDLLFTLQLIEAWLSAVGKVIASQTDGDAELAESLEVNPLN